MMKKTKYLSLLLAAFLCCVSATAAKKSVLKGLTVSTVMAERSLKVVLPAPLPKKATIEFTMNGEKMDYSQLDDTSYLILIRNMRKWRVNTPSAYSIDIKAAGEKKTVYFGFREHAVENHLFVLGDTTFLLKGLVISPTQHEQFSTEAQWSGFMKNLKQRDVNFISLTPSQFSHTMLNAADRCGMIVHANLLAQSKEEVTSINPKDSKKKKKAKASKVEVKADPTATLFEEYGMHPSFFLVSMEPGRTQLGSYQQEAVLFQPSAEPESSFMADYSSKADANKITIADFSLIKDSERMNVALEKALCTEGMGALLFSSEEQMRSFDGLLLLGHPNKEFWDTSEVMHMDLVISNNTDKEISGRRLVWNICDETGLSIGSGEQLVRIPPRNKLYLGYDKQKKDYVPYVHLGGVYPGSMVRLKAKLEGTSVERMWETRTKHPARIRFMNEKLSERMKAWCKRMPGETDEEYNFRVNEVTKLRQKKFYANEITTEMAGDVSLAGSKPKLGSYDRRSGTLTLSFGGNVTAGGRAKLTRKKAMTDAAGEVTEVAEEEITAIEQKLPSIKIPMSSEAAASITSADDLELSDVMYGLQKKDAFEIVYAKVTNKVTGEVFIYDNLERESLDRLLNDPRYIPEELMELAEAKDVALQNIKEKVIDEARRSGLLSEHTHIAVSNLVTTDFSESGEVFKNYKVDFTYNVDAAYSAQEDFAPGRYRVQDSHAAVSLAEIIKSAFEKEFTQYLKPGKRLDISITGSADSSPIRGSIAYDGVYGEILDEPYFLKEEPSKMTVTTAGGIKENAQLAYIRARGLGSLLQGQLPNTKDMDVRFLYNIELPKGTGAQYRRIKVSVNFVDTF